MGKFIDRTGERYGRLEVLCRGDDDKKNHKVRWRCKCDCGNIVEIDGASLSNGRTKSCGCLRKELVSKKFTKLGITYKAMQKRVARRSMDIEVYQRKDIA